LQASSIRDPDGNEWKPVVERSVSFYDTRVPKGTAVFALAYRKIPPAAPKIPAPAIV